MIKGREKDIPNTPVIPRVLEKRVTSSRGIKQGGRCVSDGVSDASESKYPRIETARAAISEYQSISR